MYSLKAVLFPRGNTLSSIPVASTVHKKETYENKKEVFSCVTYKIYQ
jgi:hypothetical protein